MNILFLDIDGVLNNASWAERMSPTMMAFGHHGELWDGNITRETVGWDPTNVECLRSIIDRTQCSIVISSSWRKLHPLSAFNEFFIASGLPPVVISATPNNVGRIRGDEISQWIHDNGTPERFAILDDDSDFHPNQPLVKTSFECGLTQREVDMVVDILT